MAMNKKEQAELAEAVRAALVNRALRWTDPVPPDVMPPKGGGGPYTNGYDFNEYQMEVFAAWSSCVSHGKGHRTDDRYVSGSQQSKALFSTPLLALRAMRCAVENEAAKRLADIDALIAAEIGRATTQTESKQP